MDYSQSLRYLNTLIDYEKFSDYNYRVSYNLDNMHRLLGLLGNPQKTYPSVTVTGTKGKGSTVMMLGAVLRTAGIRAGVFISPHLISVLERIKVNGKHITEEEFAFVVSEIKKVVDKYNIKGLTFFEIITSAAFLYFSIKKAEIAVMEVGLGGRLDAVNAAQSRLSAITPISYDHVHLLGKTLQKIAREKSGIIHKNSSVIIGPQAQQALDTIMRVARKKKARALRIGKDIEIGNIETSLSGTTFNVKTPTRYYKNLCTPLAGGHQAVNAGIAVSLAENLKELFKLDIDKKHIVKGLSRVYFPGRFQVLSKRPMIILDGAQNEDSAKALNNALRSVSISKDICFIIGVSSDKDPKAIAKRLFLDSQKVIFTQSFSLRAMPARRLINIAGTPGKEHFVCYDISDAMDFARRLLPKNGVIVVTGSLFLVGEALKLLGYKNG
jgi:dihydrofolate synthase / folylpolyglutamate synthase